MADFNFYLNTQGLRGRTGLKGDAGFAPIIAIGQNTLNTFTLLITTADGTFETPNLRGSIINNVGSGTFLRYDAETDSIYLSELPAASETAVGGVTLATDEELFNAAGTGVVTADNIGVGIYGALKAGNNVTLSLDDETGLVTISAEGGTQGTMNYEELTNKPSLYGTEIVGDKTLSDFVELKAPLSETVGVDYEADIVIQNGEITEENLVFKDDWHPQFSSQNSPYPFYTDGSFTLKGNEFTPNSYASMPYKLGDIIGFPANTGADIACGHIDESGQFIFTHLLRVDGLGQADGGIRSVLHIASKSSDGTKLNCTPSVNGSVTRLTNKSFNDGSCYLQIRVEDNKMVAVFLKSYTTGYVDGYKVTNVTELAVSDTNALTRIMFGGTDILSNPLNQFKIYRQPNINLEECVNQSAFAGLTNMVNWAFPDQTPSLSVKVDEQTIVVNNNDSLAVSDKVMRKEQLKDMVNAGENIHITSDNTGAITINSSAGAREVDYSEISNTPEFVQPLEQVTKSTTTDAKTGMTISGDYISVDSGASVSIDGSYTPPRWYDNYSGLYHLTLNSNLTGCKFPSCVSFPYTITSASNIIKAPLRDATILLGYYDDDGFFIPCIRFDKAITDSVFTRGSSSSYVTRGETSFESYTSLTNKTLPSEDPTTVPFTAYIQYTFDEGNNRVDATYLTKNNNVVDYCTQYHFPSNDAVNELARKVTHCVITGLPTNTNYFKVSQFGLYGALEGKLGVDYNPADVVAQSANMLDLNSSITTTTRKVNLKYDNQTLQLNAEGQLVVNMNEIGGDVSALSARVTTLENTVDTMETTITDMQGAIESIDAYTKTETDNLLAAKQDILVSGTNIKTINGESILGEGNLTISGGGEGGASIDDSITSSTTTWSSAKINTELTSRDATITEAQNEITLVQGDVAALDADVSTLNTTVANHTTSISAINDSVEQLMTSSKYTGGTGIDITNNEVSLITQKSGGADYTLSGSPTITDNVYVNKRGTSHPFKKFDTPFKVTNGTIFRTKFKINDTGYSMLFGLFTDESAQYAGLSAYVTPTYVNIGGEMYFADGSATINQDTEYYFEGGVNNDGYLYVKIGSTLGGDDIANHVSSTTYSDANEYSVIRIGYHTSQSYRLYGSIYLADTSITFPNGTKWVAYAPEVTPAIATNDKLGLVKPDGTTLAVAEDGTISASPIYTLITQLTDRIAALEAEINGGNA